VTKTLILLNVAVFAYEISLSKVQLQEFLFAYGLIPKLVHEPALRARMELEGSHVLKTFGTFMFLHGGWLHIISNMWYLWVFGDNVEDRLGHGRFLLFYLAAGVASGLTHVSFVPNSAMPCIGASGAVAGVLGAYVVMYPHARVATLVPIFFFVTVVRMPAIVLLGFWFFTQLFNSALSLGAGMQRTGVAYWAHVGGFIAGIVLLGLLMPARRKPPRENDFCFID